MSDQDSKSRSEAKKSNMSYRDSKPHSDSTFVSQSGLHICTFLILLYILFQKVDGVDPFYNLNNEIRERREKKREGSLDLEDLLGAVHFHLVAWYLETSLLAVKGFPLGFPTLQVSTYL
ncbi:Uncharacterized protein Adt_38139 [Abeliophyllum distichum]|uniref:Uncharacterized protein n=1 Tax=Abeliophyllum distichum TaxID=126358 RepID=A0ABD1Q301_9LAMI